MYCCSFSTSTDSEKRTVLTELCCSVWLGTAIIIALIFTTVLQNRSYTLKRDDNGSSTESLYELRITNVKINFDKALKMTKGQKC